MRTRLAVSILVIPALFLLAGPARAAKIPELPAVDGYKAKLHVAGGLTITSTYDTTGSCAPGRAWTLREKIDMEVNGTVRVTRFRNTISSNFARSRGARQSSRISNYRTTNYCPPTEPAKLEKPDCSTFNGIGLANLIPDPRLNGKVSIAMTRKGGGAQDLSCLGPTVDSTPRGSVVTALQLTFTPITLPLNLRVKSFETLKEGKSLIRVVRIGGPCEAAAVYRGANASALAGVSATGDQTCEVSGVFNVLVKRL